MRPLMGYHHFNEGEIEKSALMLEIAEIETVTGCTPGADTFT